MGRCKKLGSLKSFLRYSSSVSYFPLSWIPLGCTEVGVGRELHCLLATTFFFFLQDWQAASCLGFKKKNHYFIVYTSSEWFWISSAQSVTQSCPTLCNPMAEPRQASLSITNSRNLLKLKSIESVMPSEHLIFCHPLLLWPSIFPSIRVFSNESALLIRWPKYWSFSFSISPSSEHPALISFRMD